MALFNVLLKAVPWGALLANGPGIVRAAEGLLGRTRPEPVPDRTGDELRALADRVTSLEANQAEMSELVRRMADHTQRLAESSEILAARLRWLAAGAGLALLLAIVALVLALM